MKPCNSSEYKQVTGHPACNRSLSAKKESLGTRTVDYVNDAIDVNKTLD